MLEAQIQQILFYYLKIHSDQKKIQSDHKGICHKLQKKNVQGKVEINVLNDNKAPIHMESI